MTLTESLKHSGRISHTTIQIKTLQIRIYHEYSGAVDRGSPSFTSPIPVLSIPLWTLFTISRSDCGVFLEMIPGEVQGWPGGSTVIHRRGNDDRRVVGLKTLRKAPILRQ